MNNEWVYEQIAKIAHEMNKRWCELTGDFSQQKWEKAPKWQKESCINGVRYHAENPDSKPSDSHNAWMKEKMANGWTWGPEKDHDSKSHPCIIDYDELSPIQKAKDIIFITVVRALLEQ